MEKKQGGERPFQNVHNGWGVGVVEGGRACPPFCDKPLRKFQWVGEVNVKLTPLRNAEKKIMKYFCDFDYKHGEYLVLNLCAKDSVVIHSKWFAYSTRQKHLSCLSYVMKK